MRYSSASIAIAATMMVLAWPRESPASPPLATVAFSRHITWRGTITRSAGASGTFTVRTHYISAFGDYWYDGRYRCHGAGCVARRGSAAFYPIPGTEMVDDVRFCYHHGGYFYCCGLVPPHRALPAWTVKGPFSCDRVQGKLDSKPVATGVLVLSAQLGAN
jgi:hypothetical protein